MCTLDILLEFGDVLKSVFQQFFYLQAITDLNLLLFSVEFTSSVLHFLFMLFFQNFNLQAFEPDLFLTVLDVSIEMVDLVF